MSIQITKYDWSAASESQSPSPIQENILLAWERLDSGKKLRSRDELIAMAECGLDGDEGMDELYLFEFDEEGKVMVEVEIVGNVLVPLDAIVPPGEDRENLDRILHAIYSERKCIKAT